MIKLALLAIAHGSSSPEHIDTICRLVGSLVEKIQKALPEVSLTAYDVAFMGKRRGLKSVSEALRELAEKCDIILVLPVFLTPGKHVKQDVPRELEVGLESCEPNTVTTVVINGRRITLLYAAPIGFDIRVVEILLDRVKEALQVLDYRKNERS